MAQYTFPALSPPNHSIDQIRQSINGFKALSLDKNLLLQNNGAWPLAHCRQQPGDHQGNIDQRHQRTQQGGACYLLRAGIE